MRLTPFHTPLLSLASTSVLALTAAALTAVAVPAHAASAPGVPTGIHVSSATSTSFTVGMNPATSVQYYRVFASTTLSDIYVVNIAKAHASALTSAPTVTLSGLTYTSSAYYYRVETLNGPYHGWSTSYVAGLKPVTPTSVAVASSTTGGTYVTWSGGAATGAVITQSTNAAMTQNRRDFVIRGSTHVFTPYGQTPGATYYYRVRARTIATVSDYSAAVSTIIRSHAQPVRVMTYNVLDHACDGEVETGQHVSPWSSRLPVVASLIRAVAPDVLSVQEAATWTAQVRGPRQVDTIVGGLGSSYTLARTEVPPNEPNYYRSSDYVIYNNTRFAETGHGNFWTMPYGSHAAYTVLRSKVSGAQALFVSPHLISGDTPTVDGERETQMKWLISTVHIYQSSHANIPFVLAGDFNSHRSTSPRFDGVRSAAAAARIIDAKDVGQTLYNAQYNSFNAYNRAAPTGGGVPPYQGDDLDHIYAPPGVAVATWHLVLNLSGGRFVGVMGSDHNPVYATMSYPY